MPLKSFAELYSAADQLRAPVCVAAAGGADTTVIQALDLARRRGWVAPILTGNPAAIAERAEALEIDLSPFTILEDAEDSAKVAVQQVRDGTAQFLMKGQISTPALMQAVLHKDTGFRTGKTIGQIVLMEIVRDQKSFLMADTGITTDPSLEQKWDLIQAAAEIARKLGEPAPKIAIMSASEKVTPALPDTQAAQQLVELAQQSQLGDCHVAGPLSFDLAYAVDAGVRKRIAGNVTGHADAMIFPNLLAANLTVKAIMYTADCQFGGILTGTTHPVVFMSRADSVQTRLNSIAYAIQLRSA